MIEVVDGTGGRLRIPEDLDAFEIRVSSARDEPGGAPPLVRFRRTWRLGPDGWELPQTLAIVPAREGGGTVHVDVYGLKNGRVLQRISRTASFGFGLVALPPFALTPLCFGVVCPAGQTCEEDGVCRSAEVLDGGVPVDGGPCGAGFVACGDRCVPYDDDNCGGCGVACPADERCIANRCACGIGLARCGTACVDLSTDSSHCGACGDACALPGATSSCHAGSCAIDTCDPGQANCNGLAADGCETDLGSDPDHCGRCDNRCDAVGGATDCVGGSCRLTGCDGGRADCDGIASNGCETSLLDCGPGEDCTTSCGSTGTRDCENLCAPACTAPAETCNAADDDCDGRCDDLGTCRRAVHRGHSGTTGHVFSTDLGFVSSVGLEVESYFWVYADDPGGFSRLYRCAKASGKWFLTRNSTCEGDGSVVETLGWVAGSELCGSTPLYRLSAEGNHFYTPSATERDSAVSTYGYTYEGIEGYVFGASSG